MVADELEAIEPLWKGGLESAYAEYRRATEALEEERGSRVALAAALVEVALTLQRLGGQAPAADDLLRADLCLARASRLLADTRDRRTQVAFARAIAEQAAAAASGAQLAPTRERLLSAIEESR